MTMSVASLALIVALLQLSSTSAPPPDAVTLHLERLQRQLYKKPTLSTPEERERFCAGMDKVMRALALRAFADRKGLNVGAAFDCPAIIKEYHRTAFEPVDFTFMRLNIEPRVLAAITALGLKLPYKPVIGTLPIPTLNARALRVPGTETPLLVLNNEVFRVPYEVAKATISALGFATHTNGMASASTDEATIRRRLETAPEAIRDLEFAILRYMHVVNGSPTDQPIPLDTDLNFVITQLYYGLVEAMESYIFAHEFAHIILGHQGASSYFDASTPDVGLAAHSWTNELEADAQAFIILDQVLKARSGPNDDSWKSDPFYTFYLSAPAFFLQMMNSLERAAAILRTGTEPSGPSSTDVSLAQDAVSGLFSDPRPKPNTRLPDGYVPSSHPPYSIRLIQARIIENEALALALRESTLEPGTRGLYRFGEAFSNALSVLDEHVAQRLKARYVTNQSTTVERTQDGVRQDLSPQAILDDMKRRGVDLNVDHPDRASLLDAYSAYLLAAGDASNLAMPSDAVRTAQEGLAAELSKSGLQSQVTFRTKVPGARVYYRLAGRERSQPSRALTNEAAERMPIGLYYIWTERSGKATSSTQGPLFRIISERLTVTLEESNSGKPQ
jgi:hypothetical protein